MFPNVRLIIAAVVASVVALSCGFGLFAAFRVSHAPLTSVAASTAPFQLVAVSPVLAGWAAAAGPVGTRPQVIQTALTEASVSAPFTRDNAEAAEPAALPVTTDASLVAAAAPSAESQPTSPPSNADVLPEPPPDAAPSNDDAPTQSAAAAQSADQPSPPQAQQAVAATAAAPQSAQETVPDAAPVPPTAATMNTPPTLPAEAEPTSTAAAPDGTTQSAAEPPPAAATVAALDPVPQAAPAPASPPPAGVAPASSAANPDEEKNQAVAPTTPADPAVDATIAAKPIPKHAAERAKPARRVAHRSAARRRLAAARRIAAPPRATVENPVPSATTTTYQAFAFPQSNVPWTTQSSYAAAQQAFVTPPGAEPRIRVRRSRIRRTAARKAPAGAVAADQNAVGGPFVKPPPQ